MRKKTLFAFILSFVLLITVIVMNRVSFSKMKNYSEIVDHTREVMTLFETVSNDFKSAQIYTPTFANDSLKNFYNLYKLEADSIPKELFTLQNLVKDNPEQFNRVKEISRMIHLQYEILMQKNIAEIIDAGQGWRLDSLLKIHQLINEGVLNEKTILNERKKDLHESTRINNMLTSVFGILAVSIIVITFLSNFFLSKQRRWLENFLESILNTSQNGIVHYKAVREKGVITDFRLEFINKAIDKLLGLDSEALIGKKLSEFPSYVKGTDLINYYVKVVETGEPMNFETLYKKGEIERWLLVSLAKLDDGITASFHDITQLKKYEEELKENIKDLELSNTELEQYAYVASHDLQEPLRKIRSFGSYLQDTQGEKLDEKGKQHLEKMMNAADRMSSLIKDILSFSSLKKQEALVPTDLNRIIKTVLQDLDLLITQKNATVLSDILPVIEAIPLQMNQLFYNLVNNSLKFSKEGVKPKIRISARRITEDEKSPALLKNIPYFEFVFSDNGIGFSEEYADQIFGLFKRLNDKQFYPGSGIGLALVKKVVDNHHGEIIAQGEEGEGAQFFVYLPERQT